MKAKIKLFKKKHIRNNHPAAGQIWDVLEYDEEHDYYLLDIRGNSWYSRETWFPSDHLKLIDSKIIRHGKVKVGKELIEYAETIKHENYKVNTPKKFQINTVNTEASKKFIKKLAQKVNLRKSKLDYVFFSVKEGAEPHVDGLNPSKFTGTTYVIPIILPEGKSVITAEGESQEVKLFNVYEFDHTKMHSMELEDTDSGCVVIMVAELR
jgi:hypothetical protein